MNRTAILLVAVSSVSLLAQVSGGHHSQNADTVNGPQIQINNYPEQVRPDRRKGASLRVRADLLAADLYRFSYAREGNRTELQNKLMASAFVATLQAGPASDPATPSKLEASRSKTMSILAHWKTETSQKYVEFYWPRVNKILQELEEAKADTSGLVYAIANGGPRSVAFMLSASASTLGKPRTHGRLLTPLEASGIASGYKGMHVVFYSLKDDRESLKIATSLRDAFLKNGNEVGDSIILIDKSPVMQKGIHLIVPSPDLIFNIESITQNLREAQLQVVVDVRADTELRMGKVIIRIEIWPQPENFLNYDPAL